MLRSRPGRVAVTSAISSRVDSLARAWQVDVERVVDTESAVIAFGVRAGSRVALKVIRQACDEWLSGNVLRALAGPRIVGVLELAEGAMLLEHIEPGRSLVSMALNGDDDTATRVLGDVIRGMPAVSPTTAWPTVADWGKGFDRYIASGDIQIPPALVERAQAEWIALSASQRASRLLHGDLHHDNVLFDRHRGWVAIDPKGVVGELEFEIGAMLRNPGERPSLFTSPEVICRRASILSAELALDEGRVLRWAYAQAVLSAVWSIEDGDVPEPGHAAIILAEVIRSILSS